MNIRFDLGKILFLILLLTLSIMTATAGTLRGTVTDKQTGDPLTGATVQVQGTTTGAVADMDGNYTLELKNGVYTLLIRYVGYHDLIVEGVNIHSRGVTLTSTDIASSTGNVSIDATSGALNFSLDSDAQALGEVHVVARKNLEGERALQMERQKATLAIENLGSKEMSIKGIGNVEEGVKKITGISIADAGQLIVRGLGDRYSTTTLNGLPIASPNPDNKLIPLDLFPASTVQNITVSKVYAAEAFADYSGAHIDINTKENITDDFFTFGFNAGSKLNTFGKENYRMDRSGTLLSKSRVDPAALSMSLRDYDEYVKTHSIFDTSFDVRKRSFLPDFSGNLGFGKNFAVSGQTLSLLASISASNGWQNMEDAFYKTLEATGTVRDDFSYDSYAQELKLAALGYVGYTLRRHDHIGYTFFYARNATDTYQHRQGTDAEDHHLTGSNNITHIYALQNHQLNGTHYLDADDRWELAWGGSYSKTSSEEPDRRQVMYIRNEDGTLGLFKLNRQETMRYFGSLNEKEWNGNLALKWKWTEGNYVKAGINYKDKSRDYGATRFYYNVNKINPTVSDIYQTGDFLNQANVENGNIVIQRVMQPKDSYRAGNRIYAAYLFTDFYPTPALLVNAGVRYEQSKQWVDYASDGGDWYAEHRTLEKHDLFPTLNLKYTFDEANSLRLSASRTVTRPSFIEMAPFLYQESYGAAQIRGNGDLQNGYNYNFDLRYERFGTNGDMFSVTGYLKYLDSPIERIQELQGGATLHSFRNADNGLAGGVEMELRKQLLKDLRIGANISYMHTNVKLPQDGAYTNKERPLQGASPILANVDLTWSPRLGENRCLNMALLYNLQGKRIQAVGVSGLGDVKQQTLHTLDFSAGLDLNSHFSLKLQVHDLLNRDIIFEQEIPANGTKTEVERYKKGTGFEVGFTYKL